MKIVALVGMSGCGKTEVGDIFLKQGFEYIRFGQVVLDEVLKRGLEVNEQNERMIREGLRTQYGMAVMAERVAEKIDRFPKTAKVIADGLYSWEEYLFLKGKYNGELSVVAIHASPAVRYARTTSEKRRYDPAKDPQAKFRSYTLEQAKSRDKSEIENLHKGGPIAMADYHIVNEGNLQELKEKVENVIREIA